MFRLCCLSLLAPCLLWLLSIGTTVCAAEPAALQIGGTTLTPELVSAYRDLAVARQRLVNYRQSTLPQQRQDLQDATHMLSLRAQILRRRLADYEPFLAVGDYSPVRTAAENDWLELRHTEQRLQQVREQELTQMRQSGTCDDLYVYDVLLAALRVRAASSSPQ